MKNPLLVFVVSSLVVSTSLAAQDPAIPKPAPELARYKAFVGTWDGTGTAAGPAGMKMPWTSKTTYEWVLNGHVLKEQSRIEFGGGMPPLYFCAFHAWNVETKRHVIHQFGNPGDIASFEVHWATANQMVYSNKTMEEGQPKFERWMVKLDGDVMEMTSEAASGTGPYEEYVVGKMKRTSTKPEKLAPVDAAFTPMPGMPTTAVHMKPFAKMAGTYRMKGSFQAPGIPKSDLSSTETIRMLCGGTICEFRSKGDPHPQFGEYSGVAYFAWSARDECHVSFALNSMGEIGKMECRWLGNKAVSTWAGTWMGGKPTANSGVSEVDDQGVLKRHWMYSIIEANPPMKTFEATYEKKG